MDKVRIPRQWLTLAVFLGLLFALPAQPHPIEDTRTTVAAAPVVEIITGTVVELAIEDRVNNTTSKYYQLRRNDGTMVPLTGTEADALENGAQVAVRGQPNGTHFAVHQVQQLSPPPSLDVAAKIANMAQVQGMLTIAHADDFASGKSRFIYEVHDDTGRSTTLNVAALPSVLRGGMRVIVAGQRGADSTSLDPERI